MRKSIGRRTSKSIGRRTSKRGGRRTSKSLRKRTGRRTSKRGGRRMSKRSGRRMRGGASGGDTYNEVCERLTEKVEDYIREYNDLDGDGKLQYGKVAKAIRKGQQQPTSWMEKVGTLSRPLFEAAKIGVYVENGILNVLIDGKPSQVLCSIKDYYNKMTTEEYFPEFFDFLGEKAFNSIKSLGNPVQTFFPAIKKLSPHDINAKREVVNANPTLRNYLRLNNIVTTLNRDAADIFVLEKDMELATTHGELMKPRVPLSGSVPRSVPRSVSAISPSPFSRSARMRKGMVGQSRAAEAASTNIYSTDPTRQ
jgi:hypothetical protein